MVHTTFSAVCAISVMVYWSVYIYICVCVVDVSIDIVVCVLYQLGYEEETFFRNLAISPTTEVGRIYLSMEVLRHLVGSKRLPLPQLSWNVV